MDEARDTQCGLYPLLRNAQGGPAADGTALLVEATTEDGQPVRFALSLTEVQHFVAFLLITAGRMTGMRSDQTLTVDHVGQTRPVPVTSIAVGEPTGDEGYLGIAVGPAEMVFAIPLAALDELGRTLLTMGAKPNGRFTL